mgnify:CR=1 FL=1
MPLLILSIAALALGPPVYWIGRRWTPLLRFIDGFVLVSVGVLVMLHVLPDAWEAAGWMAIVAAVLVVAGAVLVALAPSFTMILVGRAVLGAGAEAMIVCQSAILAKWFKGKELSFAFGINLTIARLGSVSADWSPTWAGWLGSRSPRTSSTTTPSRSASSSMPWHGSARLQPPMCRRHPIRCPSPMSSAPTRCSRI